MQPAATYDVGENVLAEALAHYGMPVEVTLAAVKELRSANVVVDDFEGTAAVLRLGEDAADADIIEGDHDLSDGMPPPDYLHAAGVGAVI